MRLRHVLDQDEILLVGPPVKFHRRHAHGDEHDLLRLKGPGLETPIQQALCARNFRRCHFASGQRSFEPHLLFGLFGDSPSHEDWLQLGGCLCLLWRLLDSGLRLVGMDLSLAPDAFATWPVGTEVPTEASWVSICDAMPRSKTPQSQFLFVLNSRSKDVKNVGIEPELVNHQTWGILIQFDSSSFTSSRIFSSVP